jgi:hypothetical protein
MAEIQSMTITFSEISPEISEASITYPGFEWTLEALHPSVEEIDFAWSTFDFVKMELVNMTFLDPGVLSFRMFETAISRDRFIDSENITPINVITDSTVGIMQNITVVFECMDEFSESLTIFVDESNEYTVSTTRKPATHICRINLNDGYHVISFSGGKIGNFTIYAK